MSNSYPVNISKIPPTANTDNAPLPDDTQVSGHVVASEGEALSEDDDWDNNHVHHDFCGCKTCPECGNFTQLYPPEDLCWSCITRHEKQQEIEEVLRKFPFIKQESELDLSNLICCEWYNPKTDYCPQCSIEIDRPSFDHRLYDDIPASFKEA